MDVIFKENEKEETINIWDIFEECPLHMLPPSMATLDLTNIKHLTIRPYNSLTQKVVFMTSKWKLSSLYGDEIDENTFYENLNNKNCCSHLCMSKMMLLWINKRKINKHMNRNSRRRFLLNSLASNAPFDNEGEEQQLLRQ